MASPHQPILMMTVPMLPSRLGPCSSCLRRLSLRSSTESLSWSLQLSTFNQKPKEASMRWCGSSSVPVSRIPSQKYTPVPHCLSEKGIESGKRKRARQARQACSRASGAQTSGPVLFDHHRGTSRKGGLFVTRMVDQMVLLFIHCILTGGIFRWTTWIRKGQANLAALLYGVTEYLR